MSRPIVVTVCMGSSSESWELYQPPLPWHSRAGWRSRPQHHKRAVSLQQSNPLFDYLVGAGEQRVRHSEPDRLGGLEIDHQLVFHRCLHRQVGGFLPFENAIDVAGRAAVLVDLISPIGD